MKPLYILVFLLIAANAFGAITETGGGTQRAATAGPGSEDSRPLAFPVNVTSGCMGTVAGGIFQSGGVTSVAVTDSLGTTYTTPTVGTLGNYATFISRGIFSSSGANTVTVNPSGSSAFISFAIDEFCDTNVSPADVDGSYTTGNSATPSDSITTGVADALIIGVMIHANGAISITPGSGYTGFGEEEDGSLFTPFNAQFRLATTITSYVVDWTISGAHDFIAQSFSFSPLVSATVVRHRATWR